MRPSIIKNLMKFATCIPVGWRRLFFKLLLRVFYLLSRRYRLIALHNLRLAFPEKTEGQIRKIALGAYDNLAFIVAEYFDLPFMTKEKIQQRVRVEGYEHYRAAREQGRGLILCAGHFGNWELQAVSLPLLAEPHAIIYRPLDNPILDEITCMTRTTGGNTLIHKRGAVAESARILTGGGNVAIMVDQNMSLMSGVFVNFFGRPACTTKAVASLALSTGAHVITSFLARESAGKYRLLFNPPLELAKTGDLEADLKSNTQAMTDQVEQMVRKYPEQWLWLHQRWKTKPGQAGS